MPAKMMSEMPLPTPRLVICSPIHIRRIVPPVSVIIGGDAEEEAGIDDDMAPMLQADGDAIGLQRRQRHGAVARILVDDLAARLAFLLQRFQFGKHRRHQLDDDRGGDVGHDAEREDRHAADRAAGQHVEHVEQAAALLLHLLRQRRRIDAGHGDIGAQAGDDQRAQREEDALAQLLGLAEVAEIEIGGQLFGC